MSDPTTRFPPGFVWGAATSAYQIEGSPLADGAGASTWHRFAHTRGRVRNGDSGDVACDHYHRYRDDIALMKQLGLNAYRFSIAWGRILPEGRGQINYTGLDFYSRLVDALLEQDIAPCPTLYHWDLPAALEDRGGWLNRDSAAWFAEFAGIVFDALDDRVRLWTTLNEPWVNVDAGYVHGVHAPGYCDAAKAPLAAHNLLRAHASAVQAYRAVGRHAIGIVLNLTPQHPLTDSESDQAAAHRAHGYVNRYYLDPLLLGTYPEMLAEMFGPDWPVFEADDLTHIRQPIDFLGINYYTRNIVRAATDAAPFGFKEVPAPDRPRTDIGWEVYPQGLEEILLWVQRRYGDLPVYITENGAAYHDASCGQQDPVNDQLRIDYIKTHLQAVHQAIHKGVDVRGYFAWSLLDNFEWALGYAQRFGLVHVDFDTLKRTPKASARYYRDVIASNGAAVFKDHAE